MSVSAFPYGVLGGGGGATTPTVSLNTSNVTRTSSILTTYAVLQYNSDKTEYENSGVGDNTNTSRGLWADSGDAAGAWLARTINSGSLFADPGSGRLNMGTTRTFKCRDADPASGGQSCNLTIVMWDAASGGNQLDSVTLSLSATLFDPCPTCCFLPGTLVRMEDGYKPIGQIEVGDRVVTANGIEEVFEVLVRTNRPMRRLIFADGSDLVLSVDHPIWAANKNHYASIEPGIEYKCIGVPNQLEVGDYALRESGILIRIVGIEDYDYEGEVYTIGNLDFYAGGILVT